MWLGYSLGIIHFGYKTYWDIVHFFQMLKDLGERSPDAPTTSVQSDGNAISSSTLNPNLAERKLSCHNIPSPNKTAEFWEMVSKNKLSTMVLLTEKIKGRKEVVENLSSVFHGAIVAPEVN